MPTAENILLAPTPGSWVDYAATHWAQLLIDHANCEKKAASTALSMLFAYPEDRKLSGSLSRLAREELRHFEQVQGVMESLEVSYVRQKPARYAAGLRTAVRSSEPGRKLDLLLIGALIEARSAERFRLLAPRLPTTLGELYTRLEPLGGVSFRAVPEARAGCRLLAGPRRLRAKAHRACSR